MFIAPCPTAERLLRQIDQPGGLADVVQAGRQPHIIDRSPRSHVPTLASYPVNLRIRHPGPRLAVGGALWLQRFGCKPLSTWSLVIRAPNSPSEARLTAHLDHHSDCRLASAGTASLRRCNCSQLADQSSTSKSGPVGSGPSTKAGPSRSDPKWRATRDR